MTGRVKPRQRAPPGAGRRGTGWRPTGWHLPGAPSRHLPGRAAALSRALAEAKTSLRLLLVVTHDFEPIAGLTDHVVVLRRGKIAHEDRREDAIGKAEALGFDRAELTSLYHEYSE